MQRIPPPDSLSPDERKKVRDWFEATYPKSKINMQHVWDDCRDYYLMQGDAGNQFNWEACFRRWLRRGQTPKTKYQEAARGSSERPQEYREHKKSDLDAVASIFKSIEKKK